MYNKKYKVIEKQETEETEEETEQETQKTSEEYKHILQKKIIEYKKPKEGSKQDNYTRREIKDKLKGYKALKTHEDKKILLKLKPFKVWVKYFNLVTNQFRVGGLLKMIDPELRYIMLTNVNAKLTWSVQLDNCIIFISEDAEEKEEKDIQHDKEMKIKDALYKLYKNGKLIKK